MSKISGGAFGTSGLTAAICSRRAGCSQGSENSYLKDLRLNSSFLSAFPRGKESEHKIFDRTLNTNSFLTGV